MNRPSAASRPTNISPRRAALFELKYFFTASIQSVDGAESHSAEAVRDRIREMIENEAPREILSDDRIVSLLTADGVNIARRTVAKYREAMRIPVFGGTPPPQGRRVAASRLPLKSGSFTGPARQD